MSCLLLFFRGGRGFQFPDGLDAPEHQAGDHADKAQHQEQNRRAGAFAAATADAFSGATGEAETGEETQVDAISGATVSSKAVMRLTFPIMTSSSTQEKLK